MEARAGARWIARRFQALGHEAKLISPQFVKPFRQGNKNDFADAQAICEAASRPSMRFVSQHNEAPQIVSALHRVRESLVRDRTGTINQVHAFLLEFGISLPRGMAVIRRLLAVLEAQSLPPRLVAVLERLQVHFKYLDEQVGQIAHELLALMLRIKHRTDSLGVWVRGLLARRHSNVVACALANKLAQIAWAILARGTHYRSIEAVPTA